MTSSIFKMTWFLFISVLIERYISINLKSKKIYVLQQRIYRLEAEKFKAMQLLQKINYFETHLNTSILNTSATCVSNLKGISLFWLPGIFDKFIFI